MYSSKSLNSNYMEFFSYETREKILWISVEVLQKYKYNHKTSYSKNQYEHEISLSNIRFWFFPPYGHL